MKNREYIQAESEDYDSMSVADFLKLIRDQMCPQDALEFASKAPRIIKKAQKHVGCQNCPLIPYTIKSSNLCSELVMWLEAEWAQDKMFNH